MILLGIQAALCVLLAVIMCRWSGASVRSVLRGVCTGIVAHVLTVFTILFIYGSHRVYGVSHSLKFYLIYTAEFVVLIAVAFGIHALALRTRAFVYAGEKWRVRDVLLTIGCVLAAGLAGLFFFVPRWFSNYFGILTADQLIFMLTQANGSSTEDADLQVLNLMVVPVVASVLLGLCIGLLRSNFVAQPRGEARVILGMKRIRLGVIAALVVAMVSSIIYAFSALPLRDVIRSATERSQFLEEHYVAPTSSNVTWPAKKRNFIHIYMESVENSYFSKAEGGYMEESLMPDLAKLMKEPGSVSFSDSDVFGGPFQTYAAGHSVAGMVNMWAGVPMLAAGYRDGSQLSYPDFTTLGDMLKAQGYNTEFMLGSDSSWGGLGDYYRQHGDFKVFDLPYAKSQHLIPEDYMVWWGYEDDKLYEYAKSEITRLSKEDKPFYVVVENADTHFPDGYVSKNMTEKPFDQQYANVIFYSQKEVVKFVRWLQAQPFWNDTTVLITGDHQSMDRNFFEGWDPNYKRTIVNVYLNPAVEPSSPSITHNRQYAPFDFFPTTVRALGGQIKGEHLGIGTDLFSGEKTLIEKFGFDMVNREISKGSDFYDKHRHQRSASNKPNNVE